MVLLMKNIAVYCGSSLPQNPIYQEHAVKVSQLIADLGYGIVYGGANIGIMKIIADTALQSNAYVMGIMPRVIVEKEIAHENLSELKIVETMHERKKAMADNADIFLAFPGGCGTLDEIFEVITWNQIKVHNKPTIFYNLNGYFSHIRYFLEHGRNEGFISQEAFDHIIFVESIEELEKTIKKDNQI